MDRNLISGALQLLEQDRACALATIVRVRGSAPREVGTQMLIAADGKITGTIGGGCAEYAVRREALNVLRNGCPKLFHLDLTAGAAEEEGMVCGGAIEVFIEPLGGTF